MYITEHITGPVLIVYRKFLFPTFYAHENLEYIHTYLYKQLLIYLYICIHTLKKLIKLRIITEQLLLAKLMCFKRRFNKKVKARKTL